MWCHPVFTPAVPSVVPSVLDGRALSATEVMLFWAPVMHQSVEGYQVNIHTLSNSSSHLQTPNMLSDAACVSGDFSWSTGGRKSRMIQPTPPLWCPAWTTRLVLRDSNQTHATSWKCGHLTRLDWDPPNGLTLPPRKHVRAFLYTQYIDPSAHRRGKLMYTISTSICM